MKKVSIVILNWNGTKDTIECLKSIRQLLTTNYQLLTIVVDNGSKDRFEIDAPGGPSFASLRFKNEVRIIRNKENLGFAEGNNVGIKDVLKDGADYVMLLNNDTLVDKNLIDESLIVFKKNVKVGVVAPKIYFAPGFEFHKERYKKEDLGKVFWYAGGIMNWENVLGSHRGVDEVDNGQYEKTEETDYASGCCMMVKREVFEKVGLFDSKYFLYYEDNDFCQRVKGKGYGVMYAPRAILWHKNAGSAGGSGSTLQDYYITRNRLLFGMRYAPLKSKLALIKESIKLLINGRSWQKKGVLDFYLGRLGKGSYQI